MNSLRHRTGNQFATTGNQFRFIRVEQGNGLTIDPLDPMKPLFQADA